MNITNYTLIGQATSMNTDITLTQNLSDYPFICWETMQGFNATESTSGQNQLTAIFFATETIKRTGQIVGVSPVWGNQDKLQLVLAYVSEKKLQAQGLGATVNYFQWHRIYGIG